MTNEVPIEEINEAYRRLSATTEALANADRSHDELNVSEISGKLDGLSAQELEKVRNYERRNKNRETLVGQIELIGSILNVIGSPSISSGPIVYDDPDTKPGSAGTMI